MGGSSGSSFVRHDDPAVSPGGLKYLVLKVPGQSLTESMGFVLEHLKYIVFGPSGSG